MVLSPGFLINLNLLQPGQHQSIAANIASQVPEASGTGVDVLIATGLILFVLTLGVNLLARCAHRAPRRVLGSQLMTPTTVALHQTRRLPAWVPWAVLAVSLAVAAAILGIGGTPTVAGVAFLGAIVHVVAVVAVSWQVEGPRWAKDR